MNSSEIPAFTSINVSYYFPRFLVCAMILDSSNNGYVNVLLKRDDGILLRVEFV